MPTSPDFFQTLESRKGTRATVKSPKQVGGQRIVKRKAEVSCDRDPLPPASEAFPLPPRQPDVPGSRPFSNTHVLQRKPRPPREPAAREGRAQAAAETGTRAGARPAHSAAHATPSAHCPSQARAGVGVGAGPATAAPPRAGGGRFPQSRRQRQTGGGGGGSQRLPQTQPRSLQPGAASRRVPRAPPGRPRQARLCATARRRAPRASLPAGAGRGGAGWYRG